MLSIRYATAADIPLIRTLTYQIWPQTYENILTRQQIDYMLQLIYSEKALKKQMEEGHQFMVVYDDAVPAGFASFSETEPAVFKLHKIYQLANQQGRGTGRFMIEQVMAAIRPKGAVALRLNVNRYNRARSFYEKLGFTVISEEKIDIGQGFFMDDYIMEKKLTDYHDELHHHEN